MTRPTVWVLREQSAFRNDTVTPFDYSPAYQFGDIRFITDLDYPLTPGSAYAEQWRTQVARFFRDYDPRTDWIIPTGSPTGILKLGMELQKLDSKWLPRLLVWQQRSAQYIPHQLT